MIEYWRKYGINVHQTLLASVGDHNLRVTQWTTVPAVPEPSPEAIIKFEFHGQALELRSVVADARARIHKHKTEHATMGLTILDLGVINSEHFPFNVTGCRDLTTKIVRGLIFAPSITLLAKEVIRRIYSNGQRCYNGLHLRIEADALSAWAWEDSSQQVLWDGYIDGMKRAAFNSDTDVYIASGLDPSTKSFQETSARLQKAGLCRNILTKETFLPRIILAGLHSEQKALLDMVGMTRTLHFVSRFVPGSTLARTPHRRSNTQSAALA
ncbi:g6648 [Coccomyxa viridis]|uniref:G6648 protein n=1 Tax=Coccomyxa viridis TaxID=1274662 RepID=A0ABP1FVW4_9CHLO